MIQMLLSEKLSLWNFKLSDVLSTEFVKKTVYDKLNMKVNN